MKTNLMRVAVAGFVFVAMALLTANSTSAQCATCTTQAVAYQAAYQPAVATQYRGWYPGKLFDSMRLRNYGYGATVANPTYGNYTASYAPSYTPYTAGYAPYVSAYAPLRRTVVARPVLQTSYYYPQVAASNCSTCVQTVARPVLLSPVVTTGCSTCAAAPCSGCSACSGVNQATFTQPGCSSCASTPNYPAQSSQLPQPQLTPDEAPPYESGYPVEDGSDGSLPGKEADPSDSSTSLEAPRLLDPSDRTARRSNSPTVNVWNAVYHKSAGKVSQTSYKPTQAEIDAQGWHSVSQGR